MKNYLVIFIIAVMVSCNTRKNEYLKISNIDDSRYKISQIGTSKSYFILGGTNSRNQAEMLITDQHGKNEFRIKLEGSDIGDLEILNDSIFAVSWFRSKSYYSIIDSSDISFSSNKGRTWNRVIRLPFQVFKIAFSRELNGYALCKDVKMGFFAIKIKFDSVNGFNWMKYGENIPNQGSSKIFVDNGKIVRAIDLQNGHLKILADSIELTSKGTLPFEISNLVSVSVNATKKDEIGFLFRSEYKSKIFVFQNGHFKSIGLPQHIEEYGATDIIIYKNQLFLVANKIEGMGNRKTIFYSNINKADWMELPIESSSYFGPWTFWEGNFIGYTGLGTIEKISLNSRLTSKE